MGKKGLIVLVGTLSIITGILYLNGLGFSYAFMETESGSEQNAVRFWSKWSIGLGLLFLIQLPPFALWLLIVISGFGNALVGIAIHSLLLALLVRIVTMGRQGGASRI
ncbi:hypothetical protein [Paenibacillus sp. LPE1-1-1.1]|uniref:hypothetical protein n=1 Tax=Paenibacillus sp. LPE1-1-1.1 TaxID=3135230 RepID=UPI00341A6971